MKKLLALIIVCLLAAAPALAQESAMPPSKSSISKDMVKKAVKYLNDNGIEKAKAAFSQKGEFYTGEYYVYVIKDDGTEIINGAFPELVDKNVLKLKDYDGYFITKEILRLSRTRGSGWVTYRWRDPVSKRKINKKAYIERVPAENLTVCCGFARKEI
jgi:signal transduction histidine kinase